MKPLLVSTFLAVLCSGLAARPSGATVYANSNFESGQLAPYTYPYTQAPNDLQITANDPTGAGMGRLVQLHYACSTAGSCYDSNRAFFCPSGSVCPPQGHGQTMFFAGDLYVAADPNIAGAMRKILYWFGSANSDFAVVRMNGTTLNCEVMNNGVPTNVGTNLVQIPFNTWHRIEMQITPNISPSSFDGVIRIWVDGIQVMNRTDLRLLTAASGTETYNIFGVGYQTQPNSANSVYDEYRYWDNVSFSDTRLAVSGTDTQAPTVPTNLRTSVVASNQVNLAWTASSDNVAVAGYRVYRNGVPLGTTSATAFSDSGLTPSTIYTYTIAAYDASANTSRPSAPFDVQTLALGASATNTNPAVSTIAVYPNPWRGDRHSGTGMTFANLPASSTLKIFTVSGHLVKTLNGSAGSAVWDLSNDSGGRVASGTYLFVVTAAGVSGAVRGKLAVIR